MRVMLAMILIQALAGGKALAKGLEELGQSNPEEAATDEADTEQGADADKAEAGTSEKPAAAAAPTAFSQSLADKLFLTTGFGWVSASKSEGEWKASGTSDVTVGYLITKLNSQMSVHGTFRYAPIAISGEQEKHLYRGIWEVFNFGGRFNYQVNPKIVAVGTGELGYVKANLNAVDGLEPVDSHAAGGAMVSVGGGADFALTERNAFSAGPRLFLGFGSYSAFQLGGAASFLF